MIPELEPHCGSWVVSERSNGKVIGEFYDRAIVERFNPETCLIETALVYLGRVNREIANALSVVKSNGFEYRVLTRLILTGAVCKRLMALSESHYDGKCKRASQQGGFIYGWRNRLVFQNIDSCADPRFKMERSAPSAEDFLQITDEWTVEITCGNDELSTVAKIGEMERYVFPNDPYGIHVSFLQLLKAAIEEYKRLNSISTHALMNATEQLP